MDNITSDPESEPQPAVVAKRRKTRASPQPRASSCNTIVSEELEGVHNTPYIATMSSAKTPLKGRKRFIADFKEATSAYGAGLEVGGLKVKGTSAYLCLVYVSIIFGANRFENRQR